MNTLEHMLCVYLLRECNECASHSYCGHDKHGLCQLEFDKTDNLHLKVVVIQQVSTQQWSLRNWLLSSWQQIATSA